MKRLVVFLVLFHLQLLLPKEVLYSIDNGENKTTTVNEIKQLPQEKKYKEVPVSWYGGRFEGLATASGDIFYADNISAAHRNLPFGSKVEFFNPKNQKRVVAVVNDRGPFTEGREFDLSERAAEILGIKRSGVQNLLIRVVSMPD